MLLCIKLKKATWKSKIDPAFDKVIKGYVKHLLTPIGKSCKDGQIGFLDEYGRGCKSYLEGLKDFFGEYLVSQVSPRVVNEFKLMRKREGVKPATINRQMAIFKRAYNIAMCEWEWITTNPIANVSCEKVNNARDRWLSLGEEKRFLDAALIGWERSSCLP